MSPFTDSPVYMSNCRHEKYKGTDWGLLGVILFKSYNKIAKSPDYFTTLPRSALCDSFTNDSSKFSSLAPTKRWSMPVLDTNKTPDYQVTNRNHCPLIISGDRLELTSYIMFFLVKFKISYPLKLRLKKYFLTWTKNENENKKHQEYLEFDHYLHHHMFFLLTDLCWWILIGCNEFSAMHNASAFYAQLCGEFNFMLYKNLIKTRALQKWLFKCAN